MIRGEGIFSFLPVQTDVRAEKEEYNSYLMDNVHTHYFRSPLRNAGYLFHRNVLQYIPVSYTHLALLSDNHNERSAEDFAGYPRCQPGG